MTQKNLALQIRASQEFLTRVDDWRRVQPDIPGRSETIRRLVEIALNKAADKKPAAVSNSPPPGRKNGVAKAVAINKVRPKSK